MPYQNGWALIETKTRQEINTWVGSTYGECPGQPNPIILPNGDHVHCPALDTDYSGYMLVTKINNDPPPVPQSVTPLQMRRALRGAGLRDKVEEYVKGLDPDAQDAWEYASEIRRDHPVLAGGAKAMGLSDDQVDDLFRKAADL